LTLTASGTRSAAAPSITRRSSCVFNTLHAPIMKAASGN
jgi:hypothetical protein